MEATAILILVNTTVLGAVAFAYALMFRKSQRQHYDHMRRVYICRFPADLPHDTVIGFMRALSGLPTPKPLAPVHSIAFETVGTVEGITHYLSIPGHVVADVESLFRTHIVGGSLVKAERDLVAEMKWEQVAEIGTSNPHIPLRTGAPAEVVRTLLSAYSTLKPGQAVMSSWIFFPAHKHPVPENEPRAKDKFSEPLFLAVGRLASTGEDADMLIRRLYTGLSSIHVYRNKFNRRHVRDAEVRDRIHRRSGVLAYPAQLNALELSILICFPFDGPNVPGLPRGRARHLAPDHMIPVEGVGVGSSSFPGMEERKLAIPIKALMMHEWVLGGTGSGKSTLLHNQAVDIMTAGYGLVVIEPKGDLARDVLRSVPIERAQDVIWFDPTDINQPIGLNVLAGPDPERTTAHLVSLFRHLYGDSWGPRLEQILRYSILTAALNGLTLYDVKQLLVNPDYRSRVVRATKDMEVKQFWRRLDDMSDTATDSVVNKLDGFLGSRAIRNIVGQSHGLNIADVVRKRKILLVPLPNALLGEANASMLGSLVFFELWSQIKQRAPQERYPIVLIADEWQNYVNQSVAVEDMLAEARSYQLGVIGANQHTGQLPPKVLAAVKANARSKIAFGLSHDDADKLYKEFAPLGSSDLQTLGQYEIAAQLMTEQGTAPVATARTPNPPQTLRSGEALIEASRSIYGKPVKQVEAELYERHKGTDTERKKPTIGRVEDV